MPLKNYESEILTCANAYKIDPFLIAAIIMAESAGTGWTWATRFEGHYSYVVTPGSYAKKLGISADTERIHQKMSWGLMQVMGGVARELGFLGYMPMLCQAEIGLRYGCKKLAICMKRFPEDDDAISAYNRGSPEQLTNGDYVNQAYVDKVKKYFRELSKGDLWKN